MFHSKTKLEVIAYLLPMMFILNLFISEISNYKPSSFYIKSISSFVLIIMVWVDYKLNKNIFFLSHFFFVKLFKMILSGLPFLLLSIVYSYNYQFGLMKIIYILISVIPSIIVFYYFLQTFSKQRIRIFINTILFIGFVFGLTSLVFSPYNQAIGYSFELSRWSHVIAGRFLSSIAVIVLLLHFTNFVKSKIVLTATTAILFVSIYFIGMRAAFLGIIILIISLFLYALITKKKEVLISITFTLLFSIVSIFLIGQFNNSATDRYNRLATSEIGKFDDGAINARLIAYKVSWENIKEYPILGIGFGGFYNNSISGDIAEIKYPHNILIEIQLELGIIGSIFFGVLFLLIFWKSYTFSIPLFVFLLFSFWLAMFSKDIATQTQLWIGMAVLGKSNFKL